MPYWRLYYHIVWATKHREPLIAEDFQPSLHDAIAAKVIDLGGVAHAVGSVADHVHLVASVPPRIALSKLVGQVKGNSSHLVNHEIRPGYRFAWQDEYGVVSLDQRRLPQVVEYVHAQAQHHGRGTVLQHLEETEGE